MNDKQRLDIYKIDTKAKIDKRKVVFVLLIILSIVCIFLIGNHIFETIERYKVYKQYEEQLDEINQQKAEEQKIIKAEEERKRQEKIPRLTEERKTKNQKYLPFRNEKGIFNF